MSRSTIFIGIASYKDPLLSHTVLHALEQAKDKSRIRFGVVDQCEPSYQWGRMDATVARQVHYLWVDPLRARGTCFARALTHTLYHGETIYLQIDAHMHFPLHWDQWVEEVLLDRMAVTPRCVVSSYPPSMVKDASGEWTIEGHPPQTVITHRVNENATFGGRGIYLDFGAWAHHGRTEPIRGHHVAGGMMIAPGSFIEQFPYDPQLYYLGEEQMLALRLYTHGWTIWHPVDNPIGHRYNDHQNPEIRPVHWSDDPNGERPISHLVWENRSYQRQRYLVGLQGYGGVYGLGSIRTIQDFATEFGVDYLRRSINYDIARSLPAEER